VRYCTCLVTVLTTDGLTVEEKLSVLLLHSIHDDSNGLGSETDKEAEHMFCRINLDGARQVVCAPPTI
jgi:hypothetical protein